MSLEDLKAQRSVLDSQIFELETAATKAELEIKYKEALPQESVNLVTAFVNEQLALGVVHITYKDTAIYGNGFFMLENGERRQLFGEPLDVKDIDGTDTLVKDNIKIVKMVPFTQELVDTINAIVVVKK